MSKTKARLDRLRKVARALREVPPEQKSLFTMQTYVHTCGTPACALGHFAARRDLQRAFKIVQRDNCTRGTYAQALYGNDWDVLSSGDYFGLERYQMNELFGSIGCDDAKTPLQAARYIERFIKRIEKEQSK